MEFSKVNKLFKHVPYTSLDPDENQLLRVVSIEHLARTNDKVFFERRRFLFHAAGTTDIHFCFLHSLTRSPPSFPPSVATLVTVCRLDFLLNSTGKKLRIRERVTRSFPIYLSPGSSPAVVQTVHHRRHHRPPPSSSSSPSTWQNSTQFPWNSRAPDRPRNSARKTIEAVEL